MKLFPSHIDLITENIKEVLNLHKNPSVVIGNSVSGKKFGSRDRKTIYNLSYEGIKHYLLIESIIGRKPKSKEDWWHFVAVLLTHLDFPLPPFDEYKDLNTDLLKEKLNDNDLSIETKYSFPSWLNSLGKKEIGSDWEEIMRISHLDQSVFLRVNKNQCTTQECQISLRKEGIETEFLADGKLVLADRKKIDRTEAYLNGWFEVQDLGSQKIVDLLAPKPNSYFIDCCAGAGGKTLHAADHMQNTGEILSMDIHPVKLKALKTRLKRNHINICHTNIVSDDLVKKNFEKGDAVLIDAPCSGTGVMQRNVETKYTLDWQKFEEILEIQESILSKYSSMVKKGGHLLYATCSVFPSENEKQVEKFLNSQAGEDFELISSETLWPKIGENDGFYMALCRKKTS